MKVIFIKAIFSYLLIEVVFIFKSIYYLFQFFNLLLKLTDDFYSNLLCDEGLLKIKSLIVWQETVLNFYNTGYSEFERLLIHSIQNRYWVP